MPGTELAHAGNISHPPLPPPSAAQPRYTSLSAYALPSTDISYGAMPSACHAAMSGTNIDGPYAKIGTDISYGATRTGRGGGHRR
eukprot:3861680-Rhodomonas_salina.2